MSQLPAHKPEEKPQQGKKADFNTQDDGNRPVTINDLRGLIPNRIEVKQRSNGLGLAGFALGVLSIIASLFAVIPIFIPVAFVLSILGVILSVIGLLKRPRGLALAGLIVSVVGFIVILFTSLTISAALASMQQKIKDLFTIRIM